MSESTDFEATNSRVAVVVEDDPAVQQLTVRTLQEAGFRAVAFWDGESALDWLREHATPSIITVDLDLPRMTGMQLAREVRHIPRLSRVPLVVLTARHAVGDALAAGRVGAVFLTKPFRIRELIELVSKLVNAPHPKQRIMIVDDDACIREALEVVVQEEGYDTICARDGLEALNLLKQASKPPSCMILDVMMPKLDGIGVASVLRVQGKMLTLPVVLVSAHADVAHHARVLGVAAHLRKPVELEELLAVIRDVTALTGTVRPST